MNDQAWFNTVAGFMVVLVVVAGAAVLLVLPTGSGTTAPSPGSPPAIPTVYRNLSITYRASAGDYDYNSLQLIVPLHVRVVFTITNFDPSVAVLPSAVDAQLAGTFGGSMTVVDHGTTVTVGGLMANGVSHTFTMSNAAYHVNVPIPPATVGAAPVKATFAVVFDTPGTFTWGCIVLCGAPTMTPGMFGEITVA